MKDRKADLDAVREATQSTVEGTSQLAKSIVGALAAAATTLVASAAAFGREAAGASPEILAVLAGFWGFFLASRAAWHLGIGSILIRMIILWGVAFLLGALAASLLPHYVGWIVGLLVLVFAPVRLIPSLPARESPDPRFQRGMKRYMKFEDAQLRAQQLREEASRAKSSDSEGT